MAPAMARRCLENKTDLRRNAEYALVGGPDVRLGCTSVGQILRSFGRFWVSNFPSSPTPNIGSCTAQNIKGNLIFRSDAGLPQLVSPCVISHLGFYRPPAEPITGSTRRSLLQAVPNEVGNGLFSGFFAGNQDVQGVPCYGAFDQRGGEGGVK